MKDLLKTFEDLWVAITFAEAGEHALSREYLVPDPGDDAEPEIGRVI